MPMNAWMNDSGSDCDSERSDDRAYVEMGPLPCNWRPCASVRMLVLELWAVSEAGDCSPDSLAEY